MGNVLNSKPITVVRGPLHMGMTYRYINTHIIGPPLVLGSEVGLI